MVPRPFHQPGTCTNGRGEEEEEGSGERGEREERGHVAMDYGRAERNWGKGGQKALQGIGGGCLPGAHRARERSGRSCPGVRQQWWPGLGEI